MNATQQASCTCNTCPGTGCTCGCQQAAAPSACPCGPQCACNAPCQCGIECRCGAGAGCTPS